MKRLKIAFLLSSIILQALLITGCKDDVTSPQENFDSPEYLMIDYLDTQNAIEDATLDSDLSIDPTLISYSFVSASDFTPGNGKLRGMMVNWLTKYDWNKHLGIILRKLKLTDEQKTEIKALVRAHHEAMKPLVKEFADANKTIIEEAKAKRKEIADDLKAGKLTREEAGKKIKDLNSETRAKIEANPATATVKTKMCANRKTLLDGIADKLTVDQKAAWDTAVARMKSPC